MYLLGIDVRYHSVLGFIYFCCIVGLQWHNCVSPAEVKRIVLGIRTWPIVHTTLLPHDYLLLEDRSVPWKLRTVTDQTLWLKAKSVQIAIQFCFH